MLSASIFGLNNAMLYFVSLYITRVILLDWTVYSKPRTSTETVQVHGKLDRYKLHFKIFTESSWIIYIFFQSVRIQIREVTDVMRENVEKVMERGERLEDLQLASDRLNVAGTEFRNSARKARYDGWLRNLFAKFGTIGIILSIVIIIIGKLNV